MPININDEASFFDLCNSFASYSKKVDLLVFRFHREEDETIKVRQNVLQPYSTQHDHGLMVTVFNAGGVGYAATPTISLDAIKTTIETATRWAQFSSSNGLLSREIQQAFQSRLFSQDRNATNTYETALKKPWDSVPLNIKVEWLINSSSRLKNHAEIVDWSISLWHIRKHKFIFACNKSGERISISQKTDHLGPEIEVAANSGTETQIRTFGRSFSHFSQAGLELLEEKRFFEIGPQISDEARALLHAPNCPSKKMDTLLAPDQMILQIHESIGHPLELDRILGDERNYAGTSFVTLDMFGRYQYGSKLLNITFDPTFHREMACYSHDDTGCKASKEFLIKEGILQRPLGGGLSHARAGIEGSGIAATRATSWNRPPIDRMANLNLEPGDSSLDEMIGAVEQGIYMKTNSSWSIDDSRNKFQFGCEWARLIEHGKLTTLVKKPNYRGLSAEFWRSLKMVGDASTMEILGTPFCGKGEPNQIMYVGHASPTALFSQVDVFGGE